MHYTGDARRAGCSSRLVEIVASTIAGTRFGIGVDPADGLLRQGAAGYQLTWMDAKVGDWVVTPRRGKAVEINALWYNALRLLERWLREASTGGDGRTTWIPTSSGRADARRVASTSGSGTPTAATSMTSSTARTAATTPLAGPTSSSPSALPNPVLDARALAAGVEQVRERLSRPSGCARSPPATPTTSPRYDGDLRARDAAYHQGTVWGWLIGPFVDAWLQHLPGRPRRSPPRCSPASIRHLNEACVGTISEIFDAEPPFTPRGCVAQAWSVAEALRAAVLLG